MKRQVFFCLAICFLFVRSSWGQIPQTISYQGVLTDASGTLVPDGNYSLTFKLYDLEAGGTHLWAETQSVTVNNGIFNVILGSAAPLDLPFDDQYWLGITVGQGSEMTPRIAMTCSPYSMNATSVSGNSNVFPSNGNVGIGTTSPGQKLTVTGTVESTTGGFKFPDGTVQTTANSGDSGNSWSLTGNSGTTPETHFLGTIDSVALNFRVNNTRALRLEFRYNSPNLIGGHQANSVLSDKFGATIGGGGSAPYPNQVTGHYGTVSGGIDNLVSNEYGTVSGGGGNEAGLTATVGGGQQNKATNDLATVGGGSHNVASGEGSAVPGGVHNTAAGNYSMAAGLKAKANHDGSFVWADAIDADFSSSVANQFLIRASGGVGIGTNQPGEQLSVAGTIESTTGGFKFPDGTVQTSAATGNGENGWSLTGNSGTTPATHFLGTIDSVALNFRVNNMRALRLEPGHDSPNVIGGHQANSVPSNKFGATIGGGGSAQHPNQVTNHYGTVSGGVDNIVSDEYGTVSGGGGNEAGLIATVGGGQQNKATGRLAAVGGGNHNVASGGDAVVPGGAYNTAAGDYSMAAGRKAKANHSGSFVWADATGEDFSSTATNQFLIRASGGVGIGTNSTSNILTIKQNSTTDPIADAWTVYSSRRWKTNISPIENSLEKVQNLRGVSFDWKADGKRDIGLIAEEVGEVIPEVVAYEENSKDAKSVDYARLVAVLIEAVKEQQTQIEKQRATIDDLTKRMTALESVNKYSSQ